jgi:hypothetical protein
MEVSGWLHAPAAFPSEKEPLVPTEQAAGWPSESVWTLRRREIEPRFVGRPTHSLVTISIVLSLPPRRWRYKPKSIKISLFLIKHHAMKTYGRVEVQLHTFLTSALDGGERSASRHCHFTPGHRAPGTRWIGHWMGSRARLDARGKREICYSCQELKPDSSVVQPLA